MSVDYINDKIDELYGDRSVPIETTRSNLQLIRDHVNMLLEALVETDEERDI